MVEELPDRLRPQNHSDVSLQTSFVSVRALDKEQSTGWALLERTQALVQDAPDFKERARPGADRSWTGNLDLLACTCLGRLLTNARNILSSAHLTGVHLKDYSKFTGGSDSSVWWTSCTWPRSASFSSVIHIHGRIRIFLAVSSWSCCISVALGFTLWKGQVFWVQIRTGWSLYVGVCSFYFPLLSWEKGYSIRQEAKTLGKHQHNHNHKSGG